MVVSFIEEIVRIPQSPLTLGINLAVLALLNIFLLVRYFGQRNHFAFRMSWAKLFVYGLFAVLMFYRLWPTIHLPAPLTLDPVAHSEWLKHLNTSHFTTTDQWYPQGLEYYLNYFATFFSYTYPKIVLVVTNFLVALIPISLFYLGALTFRGKDKWLIFPSLFFVLAAIMPMPTVFYYTDGKNSMIFAFAIAPLVLYLLTSLRNRWSGIAAAILIFATIVIHYPTGIFLLITLLVAGLMDILGWQGKRFTFDRKTFFAYLPCLALLAVFGILSLIRVVPLYLDNPLGEDKSLRVVYDFIDTYGIWKFAYQEFLRNAENAMVFGLTPAYLFIAALSAFIFAQSDNKQLPAKVLTAYGALFVLGLLIFKANLTTGIYYNFELRFFLFFPLVILISWFIYLILERSLFRLKHAAVVSVALLALLATFFLYYGWKEYQDYLAYQDARETVQGADLEAFAFMRDDIHDDKKILNQLGGGDYISGGDSGVWIPSFTDKEVAVSWLEYSSPRSFEIFDIYMALAKDDRDPALIKKLYCDYDVGYVFFGSKKVFSDNMQTETLEKNKGFEKIFSNGATIFRIATPICDNGG